MLVEKNVLCAAQGERKVVNVGGLWGGSGSGVCVRTPSDMMSVLRCRGERLGGRGGVVRA